MVRILLLSALAFAAVACDSYSPDLGQTPFLCAVEGPRCPDGYSCVDNGSGTEVCEADDNGGGPFECNDDGLEPNDSTSTPFETSLPTGAELALNGLSICPATDRDFLEFSINSAGTHFRATLTTDSSRGDLEARLLSSSGSMIATTEVTSDPDVFEMELINRLASGTYQIQITAPDAVENNYSLVLKACTGDPSCLD